MSVDVLFPEIKSATQQKTYHGDYRNKTYHKYLITPIGEHIFRLKHYSIHLVFNTGNPL